MPNSDQAPEYSQNQQEKKSIKFQAGDSVIWADEQARNQFNAPAFNYGEGPFKVLEVQGLIITIETPKGEKRFNPINFKLANDEN